MSRKEEIIRLQPYNSNLRNGRDEQMESKGYDCPVCLGNGWFWAEDPDPCCHDTVKRECRCCNGTGKVDAEITIHWKPSEGRSKV